MSKSKANKVGRARKSKELAERKIIELIKNHLEIMPNLPVPFGDDVSGVNIGKQQVAILKTDMLVGSTDVPRSMSLWQAARKAVVMSVSDFAAKGVQPMVLLVSLGLQRDMNCKDIEEIARGLNAGAREYETYIIGGDTNEASDLVISVMLFGVANKKRIMLRSGAKEGDILAVTGLFGKTAAGLRLLLNGLIASPNLREMLLRSVYMPKARLKEGLALSVSGAVSASVDSSDGLAWSIHELANMSHVGFLINSVPLAWCVHRFAEFNKLDALNLALYGGEEYELLVTVKPDLWVNAVSAVEAVGGTLLPIGQATRDLQVLVDINGQKRPIEARGWEHLKSKIG